MSQNFISTALMQFEYFDIQLQHPVWNGKKVLDFGGNVGNILKDPNCKIEEENYYCIDVSKNAIEEGQLRYPKAHFHYYNAYNYSFNPLGVHDLPIPDLGEQFDYILAYSIFTHMDQKETIHKVNQLTRFLADNGTLIFTFLVPDYNGSDFFNGFQNITNLEKRLRRLNNGELDEALFQKGLNANYLLLVDGDKLSVDGAKDHEFNTNNGETIFSYFSI